MFTIIGGDGKEYGPVSTEQIRAWIAGGRANLDTQARAAGSQEWRRLGDYAEFSPTGIVPPVMASALPTMSPAEGTPWTASGSVSAAVPAQELAGIGARIGAACINAFLYLLAAMPGSILMSLQLMRDNPDLASGGITSPEDLDLTAIYDGQIWVNLGVFAVMIVQGILLGPRGQNIGKMILGLRVVRVDGTPAGFLRAAVLRFFVPVVLMRIPILGLVFFIVDFCFIFRADRRCLHDLMAGTQVLKKT